MILNVNFLCLGYIIFVCENVCKVDCSEIFDKIIEEVWELIKIVVVECDIDDFKVVVQIYVKLQFDCIYQQFELVFCGYDFGVWFIVFERFIVFILINMDLQGNFGKKYMVLYCFFFNFVCFCECEGWFEIEEECMECLVDVGEFVVGGLFKCCNCDQFGYIFKYCKEDKCENE